MYGKHIIQRRLLIIEKGEHITQEQNSCKGRGKDPKTKFCEGMVLDRRVIPLIVIRRKGERVGTVLIGL